jgi:hypothetical protein
VTFDKLIKPADGVPEQEAGQLEPDPRLIPTYFVPLVGAYGIGSREGRDGR